ncbi:MAG TPA: TM2 domain-containing protein, partial [Leptospiraceae bacterium]|nr:TM2 domain-containing protein [Leptospiraceae bacterium]
YYEAKGSFYSGGFDWLVVLLLCFFAGFIGLHRFYTGNFIIGTFQAMTLGGFGIWSFIDLILIITGSYRDGSGKPLVKNKRG